MHAILCLVGLIGFAAFYFIFPETSQPGARGIDKMNSANHDGVDSSTSSFIFINPLEPLWLLRSPSMLLTVRFLQPINLLETWKQKSLTGIHLYKRVS